MLTDVGTTDSNVIAQKVGSENRPYHVTVNGGFQCIQSLTNGGETEPGSNDYLIAGAQCWLDQ